MTRKEFLRIMNTGKNKRELLKQFFHFTIPSILSMLAFSLYTMVDGMFVAKGVGEKALAAVNLSSPYNAAMFACGLLIAVGMATIIAIRLGKGEEDTAGQLFTQNLLVSSGAALAISILTLFNLESVAVFLGATQDTFLYVKEYVGIIAPFAIFFICAYNMEVLVKTDGTPQLAAIGVTAAGVTNVVLDWLFVMKLGWGVKGAAFATGLSQAVSTCMYLLYFFRYSKCLRFRKFKWDLGIYRYSLPLGLADGITEFSNGIVLFLFNQTILRLLGEDGVVSYTVVGYVNTFVLMMMSGTAQGIQPVCSFYYGRNERGSYEFLLKMGLGMALILGVGGWLSGTLTGKMIVSLFIHPESSLFAPSVKALGKYSWGFLFMGFNVVSAAFFTSITKAAWAFPVSLGRGLIFPALSVVLLPVWLGADEIWYAGPAAEGLCFILTGIFMAIYLKSGGAPEGGT